MWGTRTGLIAVSFAYVVAMKLAPYVLERFGFSIDPESTVYPWNFSPLMAFAIFGGAMLVRRWQFLALTLVVMLLGDFGLWLLKGSEFAFYANQPVVYGAILLGALLGNRLERRPRADLIAGTAILAELQFFVLTNFGVWYFWAGTQMAPMYSRDAAGLLACYVAGVPFFLRSLLSTGLYTTILFVAAALLVNPRRTERGQTVAGTESS